jgi:ADP-ribosylglycohydrolase
VQPDDVSGQGDGGSVIRGTRAERAWLSLEGLALGDAFGETFFGERADERVGARELRGAPWRWTDDTAMAVSVVETLLVCGRVDQDDLAERFVSRYVRDPARGYGSGTHSALSDIHAGRHWHQTSHAQFAGRGSFGNGAAMRAAVVGAWFADDLDMVVAQTRLSAEVTHTHPEGIAGAVAVALAAALACRGDTGGGFIEAVLERTPETEVRRRIDQALTLSADLPIEHVVGALGNGSEVAAHDTVPLVLWAVAQHPTDYERALWLTVSALGDRDTTCAIAGGIVACRVDHHGLPEQWLARREPLPPMVVGRGEGDARR